MMLATMGACEESDFDSILALINMAAESYRPFIPSSQWKKPYMQRDELAREISLGIKFSGLKKAGVLRGVMGLQKIDDVTLIRHTYVDPSNQRGGIGSALLFHCCKSISGMILIGTWTDATWAISFYEKHGFRKTRKSDTVRLLHQYWTVPPAQSEASVVLANPEWFNRIACDFTGQ